MWQVHTDTALATQCSTTGIALCFLEVNVVVVAIDHHFTVDGQAGASSDGLRAAAGQAGVLDIRWQT